MSDTATQSEIGLVLAEIRSIRADLQAMDKKLDLHIATTAEKFNAVQSDIKALEDKVTVQIKALEDKVTVQVKALDEKVTVQIKALDEKVSDLSDRQRVVDSRLWGFIVALVGAIIAYLVKLSFFDRL